MAGEIFSFTVEYIFFFYTIAILTVKYILKLYRSQEVSA